jgi:phage I-like protein
VAVPDTYSFDVGGHRLLAQMRPLSDASEKTWVHLATVGKWDGHHQGEFTIDQETFKSVLANFAERKTPVKFDYEHDTQKPTNGPKPASGHILKVETRNGGTELWGFVEFTDNAAKMVKADEYNFTSVVIDFDSVDRKTGKDIGPELISAALTDTPFIDGLNPIMLTETRMADEDKPKEAQEEEDKPKEAAEDEEREAQDEEPEVDFNALGERLAESIGLDKAATLALADESIEEMSRILADKIERDGQQSEATAKPTSAVRALVEKEMRDTRRELAELKAKENERETARIAALADSMIDDGRARDGQRDDLIAALTENEARTVALFSEKVVPIRQMQAGDEIKADPKTVELSTLSSQTQLNVRALLDGGFGDERACIEQALKVERN